MTKTYPIPIPITILADHRIVEQLPKSVRKRLGDFEESGFHLGEMRRDLFYSNATLRYVLGSSSIDVELV